MRIEHLNSYQFYYQTVLNTLNSKFDNLTYSIGFPKDFADLVPPHLSVSIVASTRRESYTYERNRKVFRIMIDGFCGNLNVGGEDEARQLHQLKGDVGRIFDPRNGGILWFNLYDYSTGEANDRTKLDSVEVLDCNSRILEPGSEDTLDVEKYRFQIGLSVAVYSSQ